MKVKKLNLKKEIVANLSNAESSQIRGGKETEWVSCTCWYTDLCVTNWDTCFDVCQTDISLCWIRTCMCGETQDPATGCCGATYADCTNHQCFP